MTRLPRTLLLLLLPLTPVPAAGEVCRFAGTTVCVSSTYCVPTPPTGCVMSRDDYWDLGGTGTSERTSVSFAGAPTGGSFTLTWNGETTAPIPFEDNSLCTGLYTPFACCGRSGEGWCNLAHNIKSALEALDSIEPGDVAMAHDCSAARCDWTWIGRQVCTDVEQPTCQASLTGGGGPSCAVSTVEGGQPAATPAAVYAIGDITQDASPGAGIRVRCGSSLVAQTTGGLTFTLGPRGLRLDYGSSSTLLGGIRRGANGTAGHVAPWTPADGTWEVSSVANCPDGSCASGVRRLTVSGVPEAASIAGPGDVAYFPLGGSSMDEGFWYDVVSAQTTGGEAQIDIDPAQSQTASVGWTRARKGITPATALVAAGTGASTLRLAPGVITENDLFVGFCLYAAGYPHVIKRTIALTGDVELLRDGGLAGPVASGETVYLSTSCHRAGDEIYVAAPIRLRSATRGTAPSEQEDGLIWIRGNTNWDWVVIDWARQAMFEGITGSIDHLWLKDRGQNYSAARFDHMYGRSLGSFQVTGGPDLDGATAYANCDAGDDSDCGQHGTGFSGSVGNVVAGWFERHGGDDCLWSWDQVGRPSQNRIDVFRCQHRLGNVSSMECLSSLADDGISIGTAECINVTGRGSHGPNPGGGQVLTIGPAGGAPAQIGSLFALYGSVIASNTSMRLDNLWATRMNLVAASTNTNTPSVFFNPCAKAGVCAGDPTARNSMFTEVNNFLVDDWSSNVSASLSGNGGCIRATNGVIAHGRWAERSTDTAQDRLLQLSRCEDGPVWADNVGWIDVTVVDRSPEAHVALLYPGISEFGNLAAPGSYARNLLFYWTQASPLHEPDAGIWDGGGTVGPSSLVAGGLAFVRWNGDAPLGGAVALSPTSAANLFAGQAPLCFAGTPPVGHFPPELEPLLPPGTLVSAAPSFPAHRWVLPPEHAWSQAGCGLVGSPGVCSRQRWHQWEDVSVAQTCFGDVLAP